MMGHNPSKKRATCSGFTLFEILIAISIFSFIAITCYRILTSVSDTERITHNTWKNMHAIQLAYLIIQKDIGQMAPRPIRDAQGIKRHAFSGGNTHKGLRILMLFTRSGQINLNDEARSDMVRMLYTFESGSIVRYIWFNLDPGIEEKPVRQTILSGVSDVKIRFIDPKNSWANTWPPLTLPSKEQFYALPKGIEMQFKDEYYGTLTWFFPGVSIPPKINEKDKNKENKENKENKKNKNSQGKRYDDDDDDDDI